MSKRKKSSGIPLPDDLSGGKIADFSTPEKEERLRKKLKHISQKRRESLKKKQG